MYITYSPDNERVYVGDRGNNRLVIYDPTDYSSSVGEVAVDAEIFHMWGDRNHNQLCSDIHLRRLITRSVAFHLRSGPTGHRVLDTTASA